MAKEDSGGHSGIFKGVVVAFLGALAVGLAQLTTGLISNIFEHINVSEHRAVPDHCIVARDSGLKPDEDGMVFDPETGIVYDTNYKLEWKAGWDSDQSHSDVQRWVVSIADEDGGGWSMPTPEELKSLYKEGIGTYNRTEKLEISGWGVWSNEEGEPGKHYIFHFAYNRKGLRNDNDSNEKRGLAVRSCR